ncbi:hypothetical protein C3L33_05267, partial [Rhododendron williamsianum]
MLHIRTSPPPAKYPLKSAGGEGHWLDRELWYLVGLWPSSHYGLFYLPLSIGLRVRPISLLSRKLDGVAYEGPAFCAIAQPVLHSQSLLWNRMGRKAGGLFISSQKFGALQKPCMKEMITFLNCLALNQNNDEKCVRHKELLSVCMDGQVASESLVASLCCDVADV